MSITILPVLADNYSYLIQEGACAAVIDPSAAPPVWRVAQNAGADVTHILVTHHHYDHVSGVAALKAQTGAAVYGPSDPRIPGLDHSLAEGDTIPFGRGVFTVWETPGHGDRDCAYIWSVPGEPLALFCGDTLFVSGCGRVLEGDAASLWHSLQRLAGLPDDTAVYCGHEYTEENLRFAVAMFPDAPLYAERLREVSGLLGGGGYSVPSTMGIEKQTNPFLRVGSLEAFSALRARKNRFHG